MATQLAELLEATAQTRSILKATARVTRTALQLVTDLEERVEQLDRDLRNRTAEGGTPNVDHRTQAQARTSQAA